ncbi:DUF6000 family protein [Streptomyces sp. NPDC006872]|uniref:DUF6000 family protein n=1 Tax=Streptomyces sp. NPDC006872 TaxID=3155720 RepID=UPI0033F6923E
MALAGFGTARDADLLAAYLDRYLCRPDLAYDQTVVMGALQFIDLNLGGDQADRFLGPGGLWQPWLLDASHMQPNTDPIPSFLCGTVRGPLLLHRALRQVASWRSSGCTTARGRSFRSCRSAGTGR